MVFLWFSYEKNGRLEKDHPWTTRSVPPAEAPESQLEDIPTEIPKGGFFGANLSSGCYCSILLGQFL